MANPFVHLELNTPDLTKAKTFYGALFGWQFQDNDMGPMGVYSTFKADVGPAAA
jgi:predicted enzyme related to lactoylglutathione lyase